MGILDSVPIGLIGASVGVITSGIVQYFVYKKQVQIDQQIIAGTKLLELSKDLHYSMSKVTVKHIQAMERYSEIGERFYTYFDFTEESIECRKIITEIVMYRRLFSPVILIKDSQTMEIFNEIDYFFIKVSDYHFVKKEGALEHLKIKIEGIMNLNNILIYSIQDSMYKSITSPRKLMKRQNEPIVTPGIMNKNKPE